MKTFTLAALLLAGLCAPAFSCDLLAGPGKVVRYSEGETGGMASVACVFHDRWEVAGYWIGEQRIYNDQVRIAAYPAVSFSKLWTFREGKRFRPFLGMGLLVKGAQRCHYDGDLNCNRQLPLPYAFFPTAGFWIGPVRITAGHASNDSLDWGPEKKNLGLEPYQAQVCILGCDR
jgi:hypothetical protein